MAKSSWWRAAAAGGLVVSALSGSGAVAQDAFGLPNAELQAYLNSLETSDAEPVLTTILPPPVLEEDWPYMLPAELGVDRVPVAAADQLIVGFRPDVSPEDVAGVLDRYGLRVVDTLAPIGMVVVEVPVSSADAALAELGVSGDPTARLAEQLRAEGLTYSVTTNVVLTPNLLRDALVPQRSAGLLETAAAAVEETDWGMQQAGIEPVWASLDGQAFKVGVIDVGFADHEDLDLVPGLAVTMPRHDHGNHVAGIICAQHNQIGVRGVVPNCSSVISTSRPILDGIEDPDLIGFYTLFAELLATVVYFIEANPDVGVINLSLGYNWYPNFRIDPTRPDYAQLRDLIRGQGAFFAAVLSLAEARGVAIVSAAGNDSAVLPVPTDARWASPFNWGAKRVQELSGWSNGIVVEAHDENGIRAGFSNVGGDISAPGVNVLSALSSSPAAYGRMSGTSMASPYVSGALVLLRSVTAHRSLSEHVACLLGGSATSSSGAPMLDLGGSIQRCQ